MQFAVFSMGIAAFICAVVGCFLFFRKTGLTSPAKSKGSESTQTASAPSAPGDAFEADFYRLIFRTEDLSLEADHAPVIKAFAEQYARLVNDPGLLPRQPLILPKLLRAVRHESGNAQELVNIILEDPGLTSDVLKMANSPLYRNTREAVNDLEYAVVMLGVDGLKSLATASLIRPIFTANAKSERGLASFLWEYALASAYTAQRYATRFDQEDASSAHLLTLLTCISDFVIVQTAQKLFVQFEKTPTPAAMIHLMTSYRYEVTATLMRAWNMDDRMILSLANPASAGTSQTKTAQLVGRAIGRTVVLRDQKKLTTETITETFEAMGTDPALISYLLVASGKEED